MTTCCVLIALSALAAPTPANTELAAYLVEAGENNPALQAAHARWRAALARVPQAGALDDPMFTYGQFLVSDVNRFKLGLTQKFPWFGTRRLREASAVAEAEAAFHRMVDLRNRLSMEVKNAYLEYALLGEQIRLREDQLELLAQTEETALSLLSAGMASDADILKVQMARASMQDARDRLEDYRPALSATLAAALGRMGGEVLPWPEDPGPAPSPPETDVAVALALAASPSLRKLDALLASREARVELARKQGYPDFALNVDYVSMSKPRQVRPDRPYPASLNAARRVVNVATGTAPFDAVNAAIDAYALGTSSDPMAYSDGGDDNLMVALSVSVPIWRRKIRAGMEEARNEARAVDLDRKKEALALEAAVRGALYRHEDAVRRRALNEDQLLPQAGQRYESLQVAYGTAAEGVDFLDVLASVDDMLRYELDLAAAVRDEHRAVAELEYLLGGPWNESGGE